jgi:hypothetical protein
MSRILEAQGPQLEIFGMLLDSIDAVAPWER